MEKTTAQKMWPQRVFVSLMTNTIIPLIVIFVFSLVQIIRYQFSEKDYGFLLIGSVAAAVSVFIYTMTGYAYGAAGRKSFLAVFFTFCGFIPWAFGSYIFFYRGFWALSELHNGFEFLIIVKTILFILLGYAIVSNFYKITQADKAFLDMAKKNEWFSKEEKID